MLEYSCHQSIPIALSESEPFWFTERADKCKGGSEPVILLFIIPTSVILTDANFCF